MRLFITLFFLFAFFISNCQPSSFSWFSDDDEIRYNYISPAKDQGEQGPCGIFAAVGAVEALSHIYYNKPFPSSLGGINLSEAEIYSGCSGYGRFEAAASAREALWYADTTGIISESCFTYPSSSPFFRTDCNNICTNPSYEVNIPDYEQLSLSSNQALKRAIIDYGPVIVSAPLPHDCIVWFNSVTFHNESQLQIS